MLLAVYLCKTGVDSAWCIVRGGGAPPPPTHTHTLSTNYYKKCPKLCNMVKNVIQSPNLGKAAQWYTNYSILEPHSN